MKSDVTPAFVDPPRSNVDAHERCPHRRSMLRRLSSVSVIDFDLSGVMTNAGTSEQTSSVSLSMPCQHIRAQAPAGAQAHNSSSVTAASAQEVHLNLRRKLALTAPL